MHFVFCYLSLSSILDSGACLIHVESYPVEHQTPWNCTLWSSNITWHKAGFGALFNAVCLEYLYIPKAGVKTSHLSKYLKNANNMIRLVLRENDIDYLDYNLFSKMPKLGYLDLSTNKIPTIDFRTFINTTDLWYLDLSHNQLKDLGTQLFQNMKSMYYLDLSDNKIETLSDETFLRLRELRYLFLQENEIISLGYGLLFESQRNLLQLNLSNNKLSSVSREVLNSLDKLQNLSLGSNPFFCDCEIRSAMLWSEEKHLVTEATCQHPTLLAGHSWKVLNHSEMCKNPQNTNLYYILLLVSGIFIVILIVFCGIFIWRCRKRKPSNHGQTTNEVYDDVQVLEHIYEYPDLRRLGETRYSTEPNLPARPKNHTPHSKNILRYVPYNSGSYDDVLNRRSGSYIIPD